MTNGNNRFAHVLKPIDIGGLKVRNRVMLTTHNPKMNEDRYMAYLEERVAGGAGLVGIPVLHETISSLAFVSSGIFTPSLAGELDGAPDPETKEGAEFYDSMLIPRLRRRADVIHQHGAFCFGQIANRGSVRLPETFQAMMSPSGIADEHVRVAPHVLTSDEIARSIRLFGRSAKRIQDAKLDGVEIHAAHGYLFEQFLSPLTNKRTDAYGGSFDNRLRYLIEVIETINEFCGKEFPIGIRVSGYEEAAGGLTNDDITRIVERVAPSLVYVNVTAGTIGGLKHGVVNAYVSSNFVPSGFNVSAAAALKANIQLPVIVTGRINDPDEMEEILADGKADMIGVTRALIADPHFVQKMGDGKSGAIRKCIGLNECHFPDRASACAVNPTAGREEEFRFQPAAKPKKVLIIGGGPAGLEAARTAAKRGHQVKLVEKANRLGGNILKLAMDPSRREMAHLADWLVSEVKALDIDVALNTEVTPAFVQQTAADAVVIAVGGTMGIPEIPGIGEVPCMTALDILTSHVDLGQHVIVVGGLNDHHAPIAAAEFLAERGKKVTLTTHCHFPGQGLEPSIGHLLNKRLLEKDVEVRTLTELVAAGRVAKTRNVFSKKESAIEGVDGIVFANVRKPVEFPQIAGEVYRIGDCLAPRRIIHATTEGARIGMRL